VTDQLLNVLSVHAAYGKKDILQGASLSVAEGEIVAVFGGNGSGKSTLLKTIAGLLLPRSGSVNVAGRDITTLAPHERQRLGIGYAGQGGRVFPNLKVRENLSIARSYRRRDVALEQRVRFNAVEALMERRAGLLSGGERQMLALELVFAQAPRLLLLDEPTAALSQGSVKQILSIVLEQVRDTGCAVLLVEQNVYEATQIAHRVVRLVDGRVVE
jgi:urea transport system ATP-binding protein